MRIHRTRALAAPPSALDNIQEVTPWQPHNVRPTYVGVYETTIPLLSPVLRHRWAGFFWTEEYGTTPTVFQAFTWRGLVHKPVYANGEDPE